MINKKLMEVRFCPKCKSEDIKMKIPDAFSAAQGNHAGWKCKKCGFEFKEFPLKKK